MGDIHDIGADANADRAQQVDNAINVEIVSYPREGSQHYRVTYRGEVLIANSRVPIFDACRKLVALGLAGSLGLYRGGQLDALVRDIAVAAQYTTDESAKVSLRLARFVPYEPVSSRTAEQPSPVG